MQYRKFGHTELTTSEIGFGAWAIGGAAIVGGTPIGWGYADDTLSAKAVSAAIDAGINFFDTADFYGLGHSEELLGKLLKEHPNVIIATKVGQRNIEDRIVIDYSKNYVVEACEQSLRRLRREQIDYYQLHAARLNHLEQGDCIEAMETLKRQGKIRYWGLSLNTFHPKPEAEYMLKHQLGDGFQLVFNLINQRAAPLLQQAAEKGYGIIARMPLQFGLLTGKFSASSRFEENDHRHFRLIPEILQRSIEILDQKIWPLAAAKGRSSTEFALDFILAHPQISTVITGIRTPEQVNQNAIESKPLKEGHLLQLQQMFQSDWKPVMELMEKQG
jgi:aryl-alcohol dehydrogenase-like predicted oxidoreductase